MLAPFIFSLFLFAYHVAQAALPKVDFDRMGKVGLAGAFSGIDFIQDSVPISFDPATSTLFSRSSDGALARLATTNPGGRIHAGCTLGNVFYFAGSFSSINEVETNNIASYTSSSGKFASLGRDGPSGEIRTVFCDSKDNKVWVGGRFTSPGSSIAVWDPKANSWSPPPFIGVSGAQSIVTSIAANDTNTSLLFAGSFVTAFQSNGSITPGDNNPNVPFSSGATPFSSSLVPIPLEQAQVVGSPSSSDSQFGNIKAILCPSSADGPGSTWFAQDSNEALITIRTFTSTAANGVRLGNTFMSNHGTTGFSVITIPDNKVQTLHYIDPSSGQMQTCSNPCPLSVDSTVPYQDFLFDDTLMITGVQIKISTFSGAGAGLHMLQLLSSGAFASSLDSNNGKSCFAPNSSNTSRTGDWVAKVANTNISGTVQTVLVSTVDIGTPSSQAPSFTWVPYVSASGDYDVRMLVPGCTGFLDCGSRTQVKVSVFPGEGLPPSVSTISQTNTLDASVLVYSGLVRPSSPNFSMTVSMTLADFPSGAGVKGKYELVADRVQLVLKPSTSAFGASNGSTIAQGAKNGFGFLEWPRSDDTSNLDATKVLPNSTQTELDMVGYALLDGLGGTTSVTTDTIIAAVEHHYSGAIFFAGTFKMISGPASGSANLVMYRDGALSGLSGDGLDGSVFSLALLGDQLFVGGSFRDTNSNSTGGKLNNFALYDVQRNSWEPLGFGVDGPVFSIASSEERFVQIAGNFTQVLLTDGEGATVTGLAVWDTRARDWINSGGFVVGNMSLVSSATATTQFVAGNALRASEHGANGMVLVQNSKIDVPDIQPLGVPLGSNVAFRVQQKRSYMTGPGTWIKHHRLSQLFARQTAPAQLPPLPKPLLSPAPSILAGAFWMNGSSSSELSIIGGNFSFRNAGSPTSVTGVALYEISSSTLLGLQGNQVNGTVRSLLVVDNRLYIGGEFSLPGSDLHGLAVYDLAQNKWDNGEMQPLQANSGAAVVVRSITRSTSQPNNIIVAGTFAQAGSLQCQSICSFDSVSKQWSTLGDGIRGEIASVSYAGNNEEFLVASGSIALPDNQISNVVQYAFANRTWSAIGRPTDLPGPVTAVEVNAKNASSIFAAGRTSDGTTPFLSFWNGVNWMILGSNLQNNSTIAKLTMVPLQDTHAPNDVVEADRMLMISGMLSDRSLGDMSSALFDGRNIIPYIISSSVNGGVGSIVSLFHSFSSFSFTHRHFLATGIVILISIAIAAGVVFLLALIGILWTLFSRRDDRLEKLDPAVEEDDSIHHRPSSLLEHINAATRTTILGANPDDAIAERDKISHEEPDTFGPDASNYLRAETPSDAVGGIMPEETSRPAHARYSFDGAGEGELPLSAGAEVEVLDDRDTAWWYARDVRTGQEGVVPAAYLY